MDLHLSQSLPAGDKSCLGKDYCWCTCLSMLVYEKRLSDSMQYTNFQRKSTPIYKSRYLFSFKPAFYLPWSQSLYKLSKPVQSVDDHLRSSNPYNTSKELVLQMNDYKSSCSSCTLCHVPVVVCKLFSSL